MAQLGTTYLQVVNLVLRRLREATMSDFSSPTANQQMVMDMVNTVKHEIEAAWFWDSMRDTYELTVTPGTVSYEFTGVNGNSRVIDAWNEASHSSVNKGSYLAFNERYMNGMTVDTGLVSEYIENSVGATYLLKIDVWPSPASTQVINFNIYVAQNDYTATTDVPKIPPHVLVEGTLGYLLQERGDDSADKQLARYQRVLADAVAADASRHPEETDWTPV